MNCSLQVFLEFSEGKAQLEPFMEDDSDIRLLIEANSEMLPDMLDATMEMLSDPQKVIHCVQNKMQTWLIKACLEFRFQ